MDQATSPLADPTPYTPDDRPYFRGFDPAAVPSPCYVIDRAAVRWNLRILRDVADRSGATMLHALKAFAAPSIFDLIRSYLDGACASGRYEARLAREEIARAAPKASHPFRVHTFAPAYAADELEELLELSDHLVFNSVDQWLRYRERCRAGRGPTAAPPDAAGGPAAARLHGPDDPTVAGPDAPGDPHATAHSPGAGPPRSATASPGARPAGGPAAARPVFGLRINPECSLSEVPIYDPCAPGSRLGVTAAALTAATGSARRAQTPGGTADPLAGITELHFHALCEQDSYALETALEAVEERFGAYLRSPRITSLNIGGGHHITKPRYDREHLIELVKRTARRYDVRVTAEPGEASALHSGILVASVLDITHNELPQAILDTSATAHMPDILEMPYRPDVWGTRRPSPGGGLRYRLGGLTCLAGDVIGDYEVDRPLAPGDRLVFDDMSHYTMVKTTSFNGIPLPAIAIWDSDAPDPARSLRVVKRPAYRDFRNRLG